MCQSLLFREKSLQDQVSGFPNWRPAQEKIFPFSFINPVSEIAVEWHNRIVMIKLRNTNLGFYLAHEYENAYSSATRDQKQKIITRFRREQKSLLFAGGKLLDGESASRTVQREIREELNVQLNPFDIIYTYSAPAYGESDNVMMEQDCFFCDMKDDPMASSEIGDLDFFDSE